MIEGKVLRFTKPFPPYNPGETAGFATEQADAVLRFGVAVVDPTLKYTPATRSPGLDPPQFSLQSIATVMQEATRQAMAEQDRAVAAKKG